MSLSEVRYDAFISYRHCELDSFISENLHKKLESYKLPKSVSAKTKNGRTGIERVFRDEAELPLASNLSDPISEALANSEFLIVICTPRLKESQWCKKEVETFVATHDRQHVLLVLAEGEPNESFPEVLMYEDVKAKDDEGREITVRVDREPLAADCRADNNKDRLKALDNVVLKLCAAIFGLNYDDLKQRHRERQMRRRLIALSSALAIVTVFAITCLFFMIKISNQSKVIKDKYAGSMALASGELLSKGLRLDALYAARSVLPDKAAGGYNANALTALTDALAPYRVEKSFFPVNSFKIPMTAWGIDVSDDSAHALVRGDGYFCVIDTDSGKEISKVESAYSDYAVLDGSGVMYLNDSSEIIHLDPVTEEETVIDEEGYELYSIPGAGTVLALFPDRIKGYRDMAETFSIDITACGIDDPEYLTEDVYIAEDGRYAAFLLNGFATTWALAIDVQNGLLKKCVDLDNINSGVIACDDENIYICYENEDSSFDRSNTSTLMSVRLIDGMETLADIAGSGFFDIEIGNRGILLISDRLSYILDEGLNGVSTISGYNDAVYAFPHEEGFVILDSTGKLFPDNLYSSVDRTYELYGRTESSIVSGGLYKNGKLYVKYAGMDQVVVYSSDYNSLIAMDDIGDATPYDQYPEGELSLEGLEGIDDISVFDSAITGDGKYTLISSTDGNLIVYNAADKKMVKEIYSSDVVLLHKSYPYLKSLDAYAIETGLFNKDFDKIASLPDGKICAVGNDKRSIVVESGYAPGTYYRVPLLSYSEVIKKADELLADFVPGKAICDMYNIETPSGR